MKNAAVLVLVAVLCASCVIQPVAYDSVAEETRVAAAVEATLGVPTGGETPAAATPSPTPAQAPRTPTPAPTPTPDVIFLPEDWTEYTAYEGDLTFWHPSSWTIESTEPDGATFTDVDSLFAISAGFDDLCGTAGDTEGMAVLDCFADGLLEVVDGESDVDMRILRKEVRRFGERDGYVLEFEAQDEYVLRHAYLVAVTLEPDMLVIVLGIALDEQELGYLDLVAVSADLSGRPEGDWLADDPDQVADQADTGDLGVADWSWYLDRSGAYIHVDGVIENTSARPIMYVRVFIATYDADQNLLTTDSGYADVEYLRPGQSMTFKLVTPNLGGVEWVRIVTLEGQWAD